MLFLNSAQENALGSNPLLELDRRNLDGGKASWDVAEVDSDAAAVACAAGQLEKIDPSILAKAPDGTGAEADFLAGGLQPCSVASVAWSSLIAFDPKAWPAQAPARGAKRAKTTLQLSGPRVPAALADVFDVTAFPGKRALRKAPADLLEMSLLADGVAPSAVYAELATEAGTARAFARLEALRGHIVWIETAARAAQALTDRKAVMAMLYSGRAFQTAGVEGKALGLMWDGQIYHLDAWVIAKGTPNLDKARAFVAFASEPQRQAGVAEQFPYGPARLSATAKVGSHPVLKTAMATYLPTAPAHLRSALRHDGAFWAVHERRLMERFEAWLQAPLAKPEPPPAPVAPPPGEPVKTGDGGKAG